MMRHILEVSPFIALVIKINILIIATVTEGIVQNSITDGLAPSESN